MGIQQTITCDECGETKKEVNHWFVAWTGNSYVTIGPLSEYDMSGLRGDTRFYCGQRCCGKAHQRWMDTGSLERQDVSDVVEQHPDTA